jgi:hypothetical protein
MSTRARTWLIFAVAVAVSAVAFVIVDSGSHSVSDTLYGWAPIVAVTAAAALAASLFVTRRRS